MNALVPIRMELGPTRRNDITAVYSNGIGGSLSPLPRVLPPGPRPLGGFGLLGPLGGLGLLDPLGGVGLYGPLGGLGLFGPLGLSGFWGSGAFGPLGLGLGLFGGRVSCTRDNVLN